MGKNIKMMFSAVIMLVMTMAVNAQKIDVRLSHLLSENSSKVMSAGKTKDAAQKISVQAYLKQGAECPTTLLGQMGITVRYVVDDVAGADNKLYYPKEEAERKIEPFRAYFQLAKGVLNFNLGDVNGDGQISVTDVMGLVNMVVNDAKPQFNVVVNFDNAPISFDGEGSGPARAGENHLWSE